MTSRKKTHSLQVSGRFQMQRIWVTRSQVYFSIYYIDSPCVRASMGFDCFPSNMPSACYIQQVEKSCRRRRQEQEHACFNRNSWFGSRVCLYNNTISLNLIVHELSANSVLCALVAMLLCVTRLGGVTYDHIN